MRCLGFGMDGTIPDERGRCEYLCIIPSINSTISKNIIPLYYSSIVGTFVYIVHQPITSVLQPQCGENAQFRHVRFLTHFREHFFLKSSPQHFKVEFSAPVTCLFYFLDLSTSWNSQETALSCFYERLKRLFLSPSYPEIS